MWAGLLTSELVLALAGGALIGAAASLLLLCNGRIAGISGIVAAVLPPLAPDAFWRVAFLLGLLSGGLLLRAAYPGALAFDTVGAPFTMAASGLLVGFGARLGKGCTSGHGVCGLARRSPQSLIATLVFMACAMATVYLTRHVLS